VDRITVTVEGSSGSFTLSAIEDLEAVVKTLRDRLAQRMELVAEINFYIQGLRYALMDPVAIFGSVQMKWWGYFINTPLKDWGLEAGSEEEREARLNHIRGGLQVESREILDTRMGRFFPSKAHCGGITLDPGTYTVTINYYAGNNLISADRRENVQVQEGKLNLIESVCFKGIDLPEFETTF
jgi:hypothetical protein